MALDSLLEKVRSVSGAKASAAALVDGLAGELAALVSNKPDSELNAQLQQLATSLQLLAPELAEAVVAVAAPLPAPAPPEEKPKG